MLSIVIGFLNLLRILFLPVLALIFLYYLGQPKYCNAASNVFQMSLDISIFFYSTIICLALIFNHSLSKFTRQLYGQGTKIDIKSERSSDGY